MLQETKINKAKKILLEAKNFDWQNSTLDHMSITHQDLIWCVTEFNFLGCHQQQMFLAELKSYRLVFAIRIEFCQQHQVGV